MLSDRLVPPSADNASPQSVDGGDAAEADLLVQRARGSAAVLAAHAAETEAARRVADESLLAVREFGALALAVPRDRGGHDATMTTTVRVVAELARGCPSTAWIVALTAHAKSMIGPMASPEASSDIYADPNAIVCGWGATAQTEHTPDGLRVSGRGAYASGCEHATWAMLQAAVARPDGGARPTIVLVPMGRLDIEHTWDAVGMCGTGSHTIVADRVDVPATHELTLPTSPDDHSAVRAAIGRGVNHLAPILGAVRGALDIVDPAVRHRHIPRSRHETVADSAGARQCLAEAVDLIDGAEQRALRVARAVDELTPDQTVSHADRAALRVSLTTATTACREAMEKLLDLHGSSGLSAANPLQRYWRDVAVASRHVALVPYLYVEDYGRLLVGADSMIQSLY